MPELMSQDIAPAEDGVDARTVYMYWRKPDGMISVAPAWPSEYMLQVEQGFVPLSKYGQFTLSKSSLNPDMHHERGWRKILALGGGVEFPVEQILEYGWDRKLPLGIKADPLDVFPQLRGVEVVRYKCAHCNRDNFLTDQDRSKHEMVMHSERSDQTNLARLLGAAQKENQGPMVELMSAFAGALGQLQESQGKLAEAIERLANKPTR